MIKSLTVGLGVALSLGTALAQPAPEPAPPPAAPQEKASGETLQQPGAAGERPWAAGVAPAQQERALQLFREANTYHNDGIFVKAVELYREALKSWDHPAINYNLALSLMNL